MEIAGYRGDLYP